MFYLEGKPCSALFIAAFYGCKDIAELLIVNGASVNVVDGMGETPLHKASMKGHQDVVELLIANGAHLDAKTKDGCTPLYIAVSNHQKNIAQLLLAHGAVMEPDIAVMLGNFELVNYYLNQGVDANSKLSKGYAKGDSFLNKAIENKDKNLIELLLNKGATVKEKTGSFEFSPLHKAAIVGSREICELLIVRGADVNANDKCGEIPLHWAAKLGHQDIVELLLDCGAEVNALNVTRSSALFGAAQHHQENVVKLLLSHNAEVNLTDDQGWTPLLRALQQSGGDETVSVLLAYGADVNVRGDRGYSPLHMAVAHKNKNIVELLLTNGAKEGLA
jgi:ankyrin repeat protein